MSEPLATVWWEEDETITRDVVRYCLRCQADSDFEVVSPRGTAHYGADDGETRCGIDATGNDWWWRT